MGKLKVQISNHQNKVKIPSGIRLLLRRCCHAVLENENFADAAEVSISFIDDEEIRHLNAQFRGKDMATDVLSFPLGEDGQFDINNDTGKYQLGDVVISVERAKVQAELYGHSFQREIGYLTVHSMLHLLGYDHEEGGLDAAIMREKEELVMARLGLERDAQEIQEMHTGQAEVENE